MAAHVVVDIKGGFGAVARVVARLHGLAVKVEELHVSQSRLCVHLCDAADARRVSTVLARLADVDLPPQTYGPGRRACAALGDARDIRRTTYVVWSETEEEWNRRSTRHGALASAGSVAGPGSVSASHGRVSRERTRQTVVYDAADAPFARTKDRVDTLDYDVCGTCSDP